MLYPVTINIAQVMRNKDSNISVQHVFTIYLRSNTVSVTLYYI